MILVAKYLERKCRTQSKRSVWSRGTQTESSHIYLGRRSNLLRSVFPSNHLSSALRLPQPMISPIVGKVRLEGVFGLSRHTPLGLFLSHLVPNTEQSTVPNPLQQKGTKERGRHPLTATATLWDREKVHNWGFFPSQERMKWRKSYPQISEHPPWSQFLSCLILSMESGPLVQVGIKKRGGHSTAGADLQECEEAQNQSLSSNA